MVRNRGGGGEGAANGQQAEEPELELDREKGGPRVRGRHRADHVPVFPRAGSRSDRRGAQPSGPAAPPSEDPSPRGTRRRAGVEGCPKAPGCREFLMVPESLSLGQVSPLLV